MSQFEGSLAEWDEWKHKLVMACSRHPELSDAMQDVMSKAGLTYDLDAIRVDTAVKQRFTRALYRQLVAVTRGEANTVVRSVRDRGAPHCGFAALVLLSQRFNPKTPGRVLQHLTAVLNPPQVKDIRLLQKAVEEWESKRARLKSEFEEDFSDNVSIAILTAMLPRDLQDLVFQQGRVGEALQYRAVRDKVMSIASHRAQMLMPTPMDVGCLDKSSEHWEETWGDAGSLEIDAIRGQC